jgi:hypothetical protein
MLLYYLKQLKKNLWVVIMVVQEHVQQGAMDVITLVQVPVEILVISIV